MPLRLRSASVFLHGNEICLLLLSSLGRNFSALLFRVSTHSNGLMEFSEGQKFKIHLSQPVSGFKGPSNPIGEKSSGA